MKKTNIIILILLVLFSASCSKEDADDLFALSQTELTLSATGGIETLQLASSSSWTASADCPWISMNPANGTGGAELQLSIDSTLVHGMRQGNVRFRSDKGEVLYLAVNQLGYGKNICPDVDSVDIDYSASYDKRKFDVRVSTNVPFNVVVECDGQYQWLSSKDYSVSLDRGARPRTATLTFDWKLNMDPEGRDAIIRFVPSNADDKLEAPAQIVVHQKAAPRIEDNRQGDSLAVVLMASRMNTMYELDTSDNMMYWDEVDLWEATDENLPCPEAIGRVRYLALSLFETDETVAPEVKHLKYLEQLSIFGNVNSMLKSIELGSEVCGLKYLRELQVAAYGLVSLPEDFTKLGSTLETLNLSSNNFTDIPDCITKENFPKLKKLIFNDNRRWTCLDLRDCENSDYSGGIGFHLNLTKSKASSVRRLFLWDTLEQLALSYNYLEGEVPDFEIGEEGVEGWSEADIAWRGDTLRNLPVKLVDGKRIPKILPNARNLAINLNFFTGKLPNWILYHPRLLDWIPESFIFTTQENSKDSKGNVVGFSNVPATFDYYYDFYPGYREKYYINEE